MAHTPPPNQPGGGRKTPSQAPLIQEDYADFEADATNVNQIPQAPGSQPPAVSRTSSQNMAPPAPQMFPQGSPHLSHMGQPPQPLMPQQQQQHTQMTGMTGMTQMGQHPSVMSQMPGPPQ